MFPLFIKTPQAYVERSPPSRTRLNSPRGTVRFFKQEALVQHIEMSSQDSRQQQSLWLSVTSSGDHDINTQADRTPFPSIEIPFMLARYLNAPIRSDPFSAYVLHEESLVRASVVQVIITQLPRYVRFRRNMEDVKADLAGLGAQFWFS